MNCAEVLDPLLTKASAGFQTQGLLCKLSHPQGFLDLSSLPQNWIPVKLVARGWCWSKTKGEAVLGVQGKGQRIREGRDGRDGATSQ